MSLKQEIENGNVTRLVVVPYKTASASAKELTQAINQRYPQLRSKLIKRDGNFKGNAQSVVITWGNTGRFTNPGLGMARRFLNHPAKTSAAASKLSTFRLLDQAGNVRIPAYTETVGVAAGWLQRGHKVVARFSLSAHSGAGIVIADANGTLYADENFRNRNFFSAPLYTTYVPKKDEYRVFVFGNTAHFAYHKKCARDVPEDDRQFMVRTHSTGWNFAKVEIDDVPAEVRTYAVNAVAALGLDFGAVDVGWNSTKKQATVYEVNSAPGIAGGTVGVFLDGLLGIEL